MSVAGYVSLLLPLWPLPGLLARPRRGTHRHARRGYRHFGTGSASVKRASIGDGIRPTIRALSVSIAGRGTPTSDEAIPATLTQRLPSRSSQSPAELPATWDYPRGAAIRDATGSASGLETDSEL